MDRQQRRGHLDWVWLAPRHLLSLAVVLSLIGVPVASAQSRDSLGLQRFEEGKRAFDAGDFETALNAFSASLASLPSPNTRLYVARCQRALGRIASAYTSFRLAAREAQDRFVATGERRYNATRDSAAGEAQELEPRVPHLTIRVPSDLPDDFALSLNGKALPRSAWGTTLEQDPGAVEIVAKGHRLKAFRRRLTLEEGAKEQVAVRIERLPTCYLRVEYAQKPAGMTVQFDGRAVSIDFLEETVELDPGDHALVVTAPGFSDYRWARSLKNTERTRIRVSLTPKTEASAGARGTPRWLFWSVAGASVAALAGGSYFALSAASRDAEERDKDPLIRDPDVRDDINGQARTGNLLFIGGGVLALGAGVLAFTTDWTATSSERATARRWVRTSGRAVWVGGTF